MGELSMIKLKNVLNLLEIRQNSDYVEGMEEFGLDASGYFSPGAYPFYEYDGAVIVGDESSKHADIANAIFRNYKLRHHSMFSDWQEKGKQYYSDRPMMDQWTLYANDELFTNNTYNGRFWIRRGKPTRIAFWKAPKTKQEMATFLRNMKKNALFVSGKPLTLKDVYIALPNGGFVKPEDYKGITNSVPYDHTEPPHLRKS